MASAKRNRRRVGKRSLNPKRPTTGALVPRERIDSRILFLRGQKVLLDSDLAIFYGVSTKALKQAVKRNAPRFPADFMFVLSSGERDEVVTNCDHLQKLKFSSQMPSAFTEQGVAMLSSVLRSSKAVAVNIEIMRAFVRLREVLHSHKDLARKLAEIEASFGQKSSEHEHHIRQIYDLLDQLLDPPEPPPRKRIGFRDPDAEDE